MSAVAIGCPFCGTWEGLCPVTDGYNVGCYQCPRCGTDGPYVSAVEEGWEDKALALWNSRFSAETPRGELLRSFATTAAQSEAKAFTDRGLIEAIYILLRRDDMARGGNALAFPPDNTP